MSNSPGRRAGYCERQRHAAVLRIIQDRAFGIRSWRRTSVLREGHARPQLGEPVLRDDDLRGLPADRSWTAYATSAAIIEDEASPRRARGSSRRNRRPSQLTRTLRSIVERSAHRLLVRRTRF